MRSRSLLNQVLLVNLLLVAAAVLVAALGAGRNVHVNSTRGVLILVAALFATFLGNALVLRRRFLPLERMIRAMEEADLAGPASGRVDLGSAEAAEVRRLGQALNRMLDRLETERRSAGRAAIRAQERERQRIAQDLHDEVNQALTAILLRLQATMQDAPDELRGELQETKRLANQAMDELLSIARQLRPTVLDDHGLLAALQTQVRDFSEQTGIRATFRHSGVSPRLSMEQQLVIYRVTQESLSNIAQHAEASAVIVELSFTGRTLLRVEDDGKGFTHGREGGLGLSGMRERALLAGGRLEIHSRPGEGTRVELTIG